MYHINCAPAYCFPKTKWVQYSINIALFSISCCAMYVLTLVVLCPGPQSVPQRLGSSGGKHPERRRGAVHKWANTARCHSHWRHCYSASGSQPEVGCGGHLQESRGGGERGRRLQEWGAQPCRWISQTHLRSSHVADILPCCTHGVVCCSGRAGHCGESRERSWRSWFYSGRRKRFHAWRQATSHQQDL